MLKLVLYFLHCTLVLSFYIDVVLTSTVRFNALRTERIMCRKTSEDRILNSIFFLCFYIVHNFPILTEICNSLSCPVDSPHIKPTLFKTLCFKLHMSSLFNTQCVKSLCIRYIPVVMSQRWWKRFHNKPVPCVLCVWICNISNPNAPNVSVSNKNICAFCYTKSHR